MNESEFLRARVNSHSQTPEGMRFWAYLEALHAIFNAAGRVMDLSSRSLPHKGTKSNEGDCDHACKRMPLLDVISARMKGMVATSDFGLTLKEWKDTTMTNPRWVCRSIPGQLFEINDRDTGDPVFRIRGGMMPTLTHAILIESAPQLLAALEAFVFQVRQGAVFERDAVVTQAVEAIRKARGMPL